MTLDSSSVRIYMLEGSQGASYANEAQGEQTQHTQSNNEPNTTDRHSNDSITPMDEATATNGSLAQQINQEQVDSSSSAVSTDNRKPITIEKALLIDISADKEWIGSIFETSDASGANKKIHLKMYKLYNRVSVSLDDTGYFISEEITRYMPQDMSSYYYFLSVSSDGRRVAVSFLPAQELSETKDRKIELPNTPKCLVFQVEDAKKISLENDKMKLQGKVAFLPNDHLALINRQKIKIYDCEAGYKLVKWFDVSPLFYPHTISYLADKLRWADTRLLHTTSSVNQHQKSNRSLDQFPVEMYLQLSKLIKYNVFTTTYEGNIIRLWSPETGCQLTSFKTPALEIPLALTNNGTFIATFSESANMINIYHVKTGLLANSLQTNLGDDLCEESSLDYRVTFARFCHYDTFLFLINVRQLKPSAGSNNALITFEVWDISAEKSIFQDKKKICLDWKVKNSYVEPFVMTTGGSSNWSYTAVYTTLADDGSFQFKSMPLDIFKARDPSSPDENFTYNWIAKSFNYACNDKKESYHELNDNLNDYSNTTCFQLDGNPNILLRIGRHTVQLWHVSDIKSQKGLSEKDRLIYICTFKSPLYFSNKPFNYKWYKWDKTIQENWPKFFGLQSDFNRQGSSHRISDANDAQQDEDYSGFDKEKWAKHGIRFHSNDILIIQICEPFLDMKISVLVEMHLPLEALSSKDYESTDYHFVESAISSLCYISQKLEEKSTENLKLLYTKTRDIVDGCVKQIIESESRYFTTVSGSNSLALLSMFADGRNILFRIIQCEEVALSLFTYIRNRGKTEQIHQKIDRNENALTILIESQDFALYDLLLNRVILHAEELGAGCYTAITDALIFLESRGDTDILRSSCRKLQFLNINPKILPIVKHEILKLMPIKRLHKKLKMEFRDLKPNTTNEQIPRYVNSWKDRFVYCCVSLLNPLKLRFIKYSSITKVLYAIYKQDDAFSILAYLFKNSVDPGLIEFCVVPYVYLCSYDIYGEDVENYSYNSNRDREVSLLHYVVKKLELYEKYRTLILEGQNREEGFPTKLKWSTKSWYTLLATVYGPYYDKPIYKRKSALIELALNQHENDLFSQEDTVLEVLLYFKWKRKIKYRFFLVCFIHAVYYVSFSVGVLFAREGFDYTVGMPIDNNAKHILTVALMLISCGVLWFQEARQFFKMGFPCLKYFRSFYNYVDLFALTLPIVNLWQMLTSKPGLDELSALTTIVLWLHGILRLRAIEFFGVTVETIIQLMKSVYKTLIIMLLVIFAFTNAFIVLLAHKDDAYFQKQYSGSIEWNNSGSSAENAVSYYDDSSSNNFKNPFKAFSTLWFFIYGVWDPINDGDAGDNYMIMVLAILFSLVTVLLFFNLVIALMSSKAEEMKALRKSVWLSHFAEVIAEIEQLWCTKSERVSRNNNPSFVYYIAKKTDIRRQADILEEESDELVQKLEARLKKRKENEVL